MMKAGLALAMIFVASGVPASGIANAEASPQLVSIELSSFRFTPSSLTFQHGRTYRLHLINSSGGGHDFTAPEFFASSDIAPTDRARVVEGKIRLAGKESADVVLTPRKAGVYQLRCSHFLHAGMGMKGQITVE